MAIVAVVAAAMAGLAGCNTPGTSQPAPTLTSAGPTPSPTPVTPSASPTPTVATISGPACSYSMASIVSYLNATELVAVGELSETNMPLLGRYGCWLLFQLPQPNNPQDVILHITSRSPMLISGPALPLGTRQELTAVGVPDQFLDIAQSLGVLGENPAGSPISRFL